MPIAHIRSATIPVTDSDKAIDFYVNKLGLELRSDEPFMGGEQTSLRWVEVAPRGAQTVLILAHGYGRDADQIGKFAGIVLAVEDIYATCEQLRSRGVDFVEEPTEQPWGMIQAIIHDQDNNSLVLVGT
jgi:catechol 2,3-dioxygenase-like lactoylglutathione lyase family enzyme